MRRIGWILGGAAVVVGTVIAGVALINDSAGETEVDKVSGRSATPAQGPPSTLSPPPPPTTARAPIPATAPTTSQVPDPAQQLATFITQAEAALTRPWDRCTNTEQGFSVAAPAGWFTGTPYPATAAEWAARGASLSYYDCAAFHFEPFSIVYQTDSSAAAWIHVGAYGVSVGETYATTVARIGTDSYSTRYLSRRDTVIGGRPAVCWTALYTQPVLFSGEGTYTAGCVVNHELGPGRVFGVNVRVNPATNTGGTVPDDARQLVDALIARITESLSFN